MSLQDTRGARVMVSAYSDSGTVLFDDASFVLTAALHAATAGQDLSGWRMCVDIEPSSPSINTASMSSLDSYGSVPISSDMSSVVTAVDISDRVVAVNGLIDTVADPDACSTSSGPCNLRSAIAYCESILPLLLGQCIVSLPANETLQVNASFGVIIIDTEASGHIYIEGNGCMLVGVMDNGRSTRLLFVSSTPSFSLSIENITAAYFGEINQAGGVLCVLDIGTVVIQDSHFSSVVASAGGALYFESSTKIIVERCSFRDTLVAWDGGAIYMNKKNYNAMISDCIFSETSATWDGGSIFVNNGNEGLTISDCIFSNTSAGYYGGSIFVNQGNGNMIIDKCAFSDTSSTSNGGSIYMRYDNYGLVISNCTFTRSLSLVHGAAIFISEGHVRIIISDSFFVDTKAAYWGGAIYISSDNDYALLINCFFASSFAGSDGGAVYVSYGNNYLTILDCIFLDSEALSNAGALMISQGNDYMTVSNCYFADTFAGVAGGALFVAQDNKDLIISECHFTGTLSLTGAGSIYVFQGNDELFLSKCTFIDSSTLSSGGILIIYQTNYMIIIVDNVFSGATAGDEGGAIFSFQDNYQMVITDCSFTETSAGLGGGAVYIFQNNDAVHISNCTFMNNEAGLDGGAIFFDQSNFGVTVSACSFSYTFAGANGGALFLLQNNGGMSLSRCNFTAISALLNGGAVVVSQGNLRIDIFNCIFFNVNAGANGGALYMQDGNVDAVVINCWFESNTAQISGGAIAAVSSNDRMLIQGCTFINNIAADSGGAVDMAFSNSAPVILQSRFFLNVARLGGGLYVGPYHKDFMLWNSSIEGCLGIRGGGVYITAANIRVIIHESSVSGNVAAEEGAGLCILADSVAIEACTISFNSVSGAEGSFGGMSLTGSKYVDISNTIFVNNTAPRGGAFGVIECSDVTVLNSEFVNNTANALDGGAILAQLSGLHISNSTFKANVAETSGAALTSADAEYIFLSQCMLGQNVAISGNGAALLLSGTFKADISMNSFDGNTAPKGGGTVYWLASTMMEPEGLSTSNLFFDSNSALYGGWVATEAMQLSLDPQNVYDVTDYDASVANVVVYAKDFYDQTVKTESAALIDAEVPSSEGCFGKSGYVTGGIFESFISGVANFSTLEVYCAPGYSMPVTLTTNVEGMLLKTSFELQFRECVTGEYYGENVCLECERGTFSVTDPATVTSLLDLRQNDVCEDCPAGASVCYGNYILLEKDRWRISSSATTPLRCPYTESCKGGSGIGNELCSDGYKGPICGVCADDYAFQESSQKCVPCSESNGVDASTVLVAIMIVLCGLLALYLYCNEEVRKQVKTLDDFYAFLFVKLKLVNGSSSTVKQDVATVRWKIAIRLKMCVILWQIVSLLPYTLDLTFPDIYESLASVLNVFNLGVSVSSLVSCSSDTTFDAIDSLILATISPIALTAFIWLLRAVHIRCCQTKDDATISAISARYFGLFLVFTYLILPSVSLKIFQTFSCRDVDPDDVNEGDDVYMSVDFNVSCKSDKYRFGFVWAIVSILIYPVGVPLYYFYLLYSARGDIQSHDDAGCSAEMTVAREMRLRPIRLLFDLYTPDMWYWEVVETAHRLMLTGVLVVIARGSGAQIVTGAVISLVFLKICDVLRPYAHNEMQTLREICQWQIFALFFLALLLKSDFESVNATALTALLIIAVVVNVVWDLARFFWLRYIGLGQLEKYGNHILNASHDGALDPISKVSTDENFESIEAIEMREQKTT